MSSQVTDDELLALKRATKLSGKQRLLVGQLLTEREQASESEIKHQRSLQRLLTPDSSRHSQEWQEEHEAQAQEATPADCGPILAGFEQRIAEKEEASLMQHQRMSAKIERNQLALPKLSLPRLSKHRNAQISQAFTERSRSLKPTKRAQLASIQQLQHEGDASSDASDSFQIAEDKASTTLPQIVEPTPSKLGGMQRTGSHLVQTIQARQTLSHSKITGGFGIRTSSDSLSAQPEDPPAFGKVFDAAEVKQARSIFRNRAQSYVGNKAIQAALKQDNGQGSLRSLHRAVVCVDRAALKRPRQSESEASGATQMLTGKMGALLQQAPKFASPQPTSHLSRKRSQISSLIDVSHNIVSSQSSLAKPTFKGVFAHLPTTDSAPRILMQESSAPSEGYLSRLQSQMSSSQLIENKAMAEETRKAASQIARPGKSKFMDYRQQHAELAKQAQATRLEDMLKVIAQRTISPRCVAAAEVGSPKSVRTNNLQIPGPPKERRCTFQPKENTQFTKAAQSSRSNFPARKPSRSNLHARKSSISKELKWSPSSSPKSELPEEPINYHSDLMEVIRLYADEKNSGKRSEHAVRMLLIAKNRIFAQRQKQFDDSKPEEYEAVERYMEREDIQLEIVHKLASLTGQAQLQGMTSLHVARGLLKSTVNPVQDELSRFIASFKGVSPQVALDYTRSLIQQMISTANIARPQPREHEPSGRDSTLTVRDKESFDRLTPEPTADRGKSPTNNSDSSPLVAAGIQHQAKQLAGKLEFGNLIKAQNQPVTSQALREDPKYQLLRGFERIMQRPRQISKGLNEALTELRLVNVTFSEQYATQFASALSYLPTLQEVHLQENNLADAPLAAILLGLLRNCAVLNRLTLRGRSNELGQASVDALSKLLEREFPLQVEELTLDALRVAPGVQEPLFESLACCSARHLTLARFPVIAVFFKRFVASLPDLFMMTEITLNDLSTSPLTNFELLTQIQKCQFKQVSLSGLQLVNLSPIDPHNINPHQLDQKKTSAADEDGQDAAKEEALELRRALKAAGTLADDELDGDALENISDGGSDRGSQHGEKASAAKKKDGDKMKMLQGTKQKAKKEVNLLIRNVKCRKADSELVNEKLLEIIESMQSLIHLELSRTGLSSEMVLEIVRHLAAETHLNLRSVHLTVDDGWQVNVLDPKLKQELLKILGQHERVSSCKLEGSKTARDENLLTLHKQRQTTLQHEQRVEQGGGTFCIQRVLTREVHQHSRWELHPAQDCWVCSRANYVFINVVAPFAEGNENLTKIRFDSEVPGFESAEVSARRLHSFLYGCDRIEASGVNFDQIYKEILAEERKKGMRRERMPITVRTMKQHIARKFQLIIKHYRKRYSAPMWNALVNNNIEFPQCEKIVIDHRGPASMADPNFDKRIENHQVLACVLKPGLHTIELEFGSEKVQKQFFVNPRTNSIPFTQTDGIRRAVIFPFRKENSVFADFKEDDAIQLRLMTDHDFKNWDSALLMRSLSDADLSVVKRVIFKNAKELKDVFVLLASQHDQYPRVSFSTLVDCATRLSWFDDEEFPFSFEQFAILFAQSALPPDRIVSEKHVPIKITDETEKRSWILSRQISNLQTDSHSASVNRAQFFELMVRLAYKKFVEVDDMPLPVLGAVERLFEDELLQRLSWKAPDLFRTTQLWTSKIDLLIKVNKENIRQVYDSYCDERVKAPTLAICTRILGQHGIYSRECRQLFSRSKMTVINESSQAEKYNRLSFLEFVEFLARFARERYKRNNKVGFLQKFKVLLGEFLKEQELRLVEPDLVPDELQLDDDVESADD